MRFLLLALLLQTCLVLVAPATQVGLQLGKSTSRYASQLKVVAPQHPLVLRAAAGEEAFDRAAAAAGV